VELSTFNQYDIIKSKVVLIECRRKEKVYKNGKWFITEIVEKLLNNSMQQVSRTTEIKENN
jgi:hypothetical protein